MSLSENILDNYSDEATEARSYTPIERPEMAPVFSGSYEPDMVYDKRLHKKVLSRGEIFLGAFPPGFVADFVFTLRGIEAPTTFAIWSALFGISCSLQRRAWIEWFPKNLYPNLFLVFLSPPGISKKSSAVLFVSSLVRKIPLLFEDEADKLLFAIPIYEGSVTPEGMFDLLLPKRALVREKDATVPKEINLGSRLALIADELENFLGNQKYNTGMISRLISLYDCKDEDSKYTIKNKLIKMENVFFNFFAGTTPKSFTESIPQGAKGGGLLSRMAFVYESQPVRKIRKPFHLPGSDTPQELTAKLAWISMNKVGEYKLTAEADDFYKQWYDDYKEKFSRYDQEFDGETRGDLVLLKVATLIRAQAYTTSRDITIDDIRLASLLVDAAEKDKRKAIDLITGTEWERRMNRVVRHLKKQPKGLRRDKLLSWVSRYMRSRELDEVINTLSGGNQIKILLGEETLYRTRQSGSEVYVWTEGTE